MRFRGKSLTREILFMLAAGPIILSSFFLPNAPQMLKPLIKWRKNWDKINSKRIYEAIRRLNQKRFVELIEKGDKLYIEITDSGKRLVKNCDYDNLQLPKLKKWDKKWRLIIFDIPNEKRRERQTFSTKLKEIGLYPLQKSVFIYPYECRDEVDFICEFLSISRYVNYCVVDSLDKREGDLCRIFDLKLS